jgi:hypothetical protein
MRGLSVDSPLFRSKIQLKLCTILSNMDKHEEALSNCDSAVEVRDGSEFVSPISLKEAYLVRAEGEHRDMGEGCFYFCSCCRPIHLLHY